MNRLSCLWFAIASVVCLFTVRAAGQVVVWQENFTGQTGKGITAGPVTNMPPDLTKWSVTVHDALPTNGYFMVATNASLKEYFEGFRLGGECVWQSENITISHASWVDLSLQLQETSETTMTSNDWIGVYYRLDSGSEILFAENGFLSGEYGSTWVTAGQPNLSGTSVVIVVRMKTTDAKKNHRIDNVRVTGGSVLYPLEPGRIWINEFHYDNTGADTNEGVEIAGPAGYDLTGHKVYFYNGDNGQYYTPVLTLSGAIGNEGDGFGALWFDRVGIQNGPPDGMALIRETSSETNILQILSYGGSFRLTNGIAAGWFAGDIGVAQSEGNTTDQTLQLTGKGKNHADFTWTGPVAHSRGSLNTGQQIVRPGFIFIVR